jgi:regulation of enolase protein 1 (concanavalin A-like superfamily)
MTKMNTQKASKKRPLLKRFLLIVGGVAGLVAIMALIFTIAQFLQDSANSKSQDSANATVVSYLDQQLKVQQGIATLQASSIKTGPTATLVAHDLNELQITKSALENGYMSALTTLTAVADYRNRPGINIFSIGSTRETAAETQNFSGINFSSESNSESLSNDWKWDQGLAKDSGFKISDSGSTLTLITGLNTNMWGDQTTAPKVDYPLSGNFSVRVKVKFSGIEQWQAAGLGLRSEINPGDWIMLQRISGGQSGQEVYITQTHENNSEHILTLPFSKNEFYLCMIRTDEKISFKVSENGVNWFYLMKDYVFTLPEQIRLFLTVYSTTSHGSLASFSDLGYSLSSSEISFSPKGSIPFVDANNNQLNSFFDWYAGGSISNAFRVTNGNLLIIAGPQTEMWGSVKTAPNVEYPISGNFKAIVKLNFNGNENGQAGGFGLRSGDDLRNWISIRYVNEGGTQQKLYITRNLNDNPENTTSIPYSDKIVYLQIQREEPLISLYYSSNQDTWTPLLQDFVMGFPEANYLFFYANSPTGHGDQAEFSDFSVYPP